MLHRIPQYFGHQEIELLLHAYVLAAYAHRNQIRESGEPYVLHPIAVSTILADLRMDADTIAAGLLHDVAEDTDFDLAYLYEHFGQDVGSLVDGVTKLKRINELSNAQQGISDAKARSLRKMFLAIVDMCGWSSSNWLTVSTTCVPSAPRRNTSSDGSPAKRWISLLH